MWVNRIVSLLFILILFQLNIYSQRVTLGYVGDREYYKGYWSGDSVLYTNSLSISVSNDVSMNELTNFLQNFNAIIRHDYIQQFNWCSIDLPVQYDALMLIQDWRREEIFTSVEPVLVFTILASVNDPYYLAGYQWALNNYGQNPPGGTVDADIDMPKGWEITMGSPNVVVAVLDSGIPQTEPFTLSHQDLSNTERIDLINSKNFTSLSTNNIKDGYGHGTHVTGIITAETNNNEGISGVAGNVRIVICRIADNDGTIASDDIKTAILYCINLNIVDIMNMSFRYTSELPDIEYALSLAETAGILTVAAAGNDHGGVGYPAKHSIEHSSIIAVSATNHDDVFSAYSNKGPEINVCAPGGVGQPYDENDIFSTFPNYPFHLQNSYPYLTQNYGYLAGTSMAAPHVTGLAALILSVNPGLEPSEVRDIIQITADDKGTLGFDIYYGHGRINTFNALRYTLENYGGTISGELTITSSEDPWVFYGDITIAEDASLTLEPGVILTFAENVSLIVNGELIAEGTSGNEIVLKNLVTEEYWGPIIFNGLSSSGSTLKYVEIEYSDGIQCLNGANVTIEHSLLDHCTEGIYFYNSQPSIINNQIIEPVHNGINGDASGMSVDILDNTITKSSSNPQYKEYQGIILANYTNGYISHNDISGFYWGMYIGGGSDAFFYSLSMQSSNPNNRSRDNRNGICAGWGGFINANNFMVDGSNNSIYNNSWYDARSYQSSMIAAQHNWWGSDGAQIYVDATSYLYANNPLTYDPWESSKQGNGIISSIIKLDYRGDNPPGFDSSDVFNGLSLELEGKINEAVLYYKQMINRNSIPGFALGRLAGIKKRYSMPNIRGYLESLTSGEENYKPIVLTLLAGIHLDENEYDKAMTKFDKIIRKYPETYFATNALFEKFFAALNYAKDLELAGQVLWELQSLGYTDEEFLIRLQIAENLYGENGPETLGKTQITYTGSEESISPNEYMLLGNYPNPFNPTTTISYAIPYQSSIELIVYDIMGREVKSFNISSQPSGYQSLTWDGTDKSGASVSSGVYLYRIAAKSLENKEVFVKTSKLMLLK